MPLSIFVASSTGSTIGQGFVFTLLSVLSIEMLSVYRRQDLFNNRFAQQAKKPLSPQEITYAVGACMLVTLCVGGIILI